MFGVIEAVATGTDPSRAPFSESALSQKHLRDYVINGLTGCRHGCLFCYIPTTPPYRYHTGNLERVDVDDPPHEWGDSVLHRDELPEQPESALESIDAGDRALATMDRGRSVFGILYSTIRFIDGPTGGITRQCVELLVEIGGREQHWIDSQLKHFRWVQAVGAELGLPDHLWPDDHLINSVDARERAWLQAWTDRESPEPFAGREPSVDPRPELPPRRPPVTDVRGWSAWRMSPRPIGGVRSVVL